MTQFKDVASRQESRICFIYGLTPRIPLAATGKYIGEVYDFGRLQAHVESGRNLLPRVIVENEFVSPNSDPTEGCGVSLLPSMRKLRAILTVTPRGDAVLVLDGELKESLSSSEVAELLAATCFERESIQVSERPVTDWLIAELANTSIYVYALKFGNDVHQCVFLGRELRDMLRLQ